MPRPMYFLAMLTTSRRLASVRAFLASSSPCSMSLAYSTSCSARSSATRPISFRYIRTGSSSETEFDRLGGGHQLLVVLHDLEVLVTVGDLDAHLPEGVEDPFQVVRLDVDLGEGGQHVVRGQVAGLLAAHDQLLGGDHQRVGGEHAGGRRRGGGSGSCRRRERSRSRRGRVDRIVGLLRGGCHSCDLLHQWWRVGGWSIGGWRPEAGVGAREGVRRVPGPIARGRGAGGSRRMPVAPA